MTGGILKGFRQYSQWLRDAAGGAHGKKVIPERQRGRAAQRKCFEYEKTDAGDKPASSIFGSAFGFYRSEV